MNAYLIVQAEKTSAADLWFAVFFTILLFRKVYRWRFQTSPRASIDTRASARCCRAPTRSRIAGVTPAVSASLPCDNLRIAGAAFKRTLLLLFDLCPVRYDRYY